MKVPSPRTSPQRPKNPKDYHHKTLTFKPHFKPLGTRRPRIRSTRALVFGSWKAGERASHEVPLVCRSRACVRIRARKLRRRDHFLGFLEFPIHKTLTCKARVLLRLVLSGCIGDFVQGLYITAKGCYTKYTRYYILNTVYSLPCTILYNIHMCTYIYIYMYVYTLPLSSLSLSICIYIYMCIYILTAQTHRL